MESKRKHLYGGLNADDDFELVADNQWVNAVCMRAITTDKGATGRLESVSGTNLLFDPDTGEDFECLGCVSDNENDLIIVFNFSPKTGNNHGIFAWSRKQQTAYTVLRTSDITGGELRMDKNFYISNIEMIEDKLYWIDADGVLCKINYKAAINFHHSGTYSDVWAYTSFTPETIYALKRPPMKSPTRLPFNDVGLAYNIVADKVYRFAARFTYKDNEVSTLSDLSETVDLRMDDDYTPPYNTIKVFFGGTGPGSTILIPEEVQKIDLIVQHLPDGRFSIIKTWDKDISADAALITNAATTPLEYHFTGTEVGETLDPAYVVKHQEFIPHFVKTMAFARNRNVLANYKSGYDSPITTSLTVDTINNITVPVIGGDYAAKVFKSDASYQTCMIFYDRLFRRCGAVPGPRFTTPDMAHYEPSDSLTRVESVKLVLGTTNYLQEIPEWAYYFRVGRTLIDRTDFFLQSNFKAGQFKYAKKDPDTGVITFDDAGYQNMIGFAIDLKNLELAGMGYNFTEGSGDVIKIYFGNQGGLTIKTRITQAEGGYIIIPWNPNQLGSGTDRNLSAVYGVYEIYTPASRDQYDTFYEYGPLLPITNPGTISRQYSTHVVTLEDGDVYLKRRKIDENNPPTRMRFEAMSPSDRQWLDWIRRTDRPNKVDTIGEKHIKTGVLWSNVNIPGTRVNGLASFEPLNEKILDSEITPIVQLKLVNKIQEDGTVMLAICERQTVSMYLGEQELFDTAGSQFITQSSNVIGTTKVLRGGFGTISPESVFEYQGLVFWWDLYNGCAVQYSTAGLENISRYKFERPSSLFSQQYLSMSISQIEALGDRAFIIGGVHPHHKEVYFSLPKLLTESPKGLLADYASDSLLANKNYPYDIYDGAAKTIAFKFLNNIWQGTVFPVQVDAFVQDSDMLFIAKSGALYDNNNLAKPAYFFGTQYKGYVMYPHSLGAECDYLSIGLDSSKAPDFMHFRTEEPYIQSTDLVNMERKGATYYASLLKDRLSPNVTGSYELKQMKGDGMFGKYLLVMVEFDVTDEPIYFKFSTLGYIINKGHLLLKQ